MEYTTYQVPVDEGRSAEKRREDRFRVVNDYVVTVMNGRFTSHIHARVVNISRGGVLMECRCRLSDILSWQNIEFHLDRFLEARADGPLVKGRFVRIQKAEPKNHFRVGLQFDEPVDPLQWSSIVTANSLEPLNA